MAWGKWTGDRLSSPLHGLYRNTALWECCFMTVIRYDRAERKRAVYISVYIPANIPANSPVPFHIRTPWGKHFGHAESGILPHAVRPKGIPAIGGFTETNQR
jgi:hypothetical protein